MDEILCGIYCIENKINNKKYIGQSINIYQRWKAHKQYAFNKNSPSYDKPLYRAIRKYGLDSFEFTIIQTCNQNELNELEKHWIQYHNAFFNGYNLTLGGDSSGIREKKENIILAFKLIEFTDLSFSEIAEQCSLSYEMIQGINTGRHWNDGRDYPIRKRKEKQVYYCCDCGIEITKGSQRCFECLLKIRKKTIPVDRNELFELITTKSFVQIGKIYNVSDNTVRKWCKRYNLPTKYNDIKNLKESIKTSSAA